MSAYIVLIGPFAPPVHGVTMSNGKLERLLASRGVRVERINLSAGSLSRGLRYHLLRLARTTWGVAKILTAPPQSRQPRAYEMSVDGGAGQIYNTLLSAAIRLRAAPLALFHHSTDYVVEDRMLMRILLRVAGPQVRHIACSDDMFAELRRRYRIQDRALIINNAVWVDELDATPESPRADVIRLGYLSALTEAKGVLRALETLRQAKRAGLSVTLTIGGSGMGPGIAGEIERAQQELGDALICLGQVTGAEKARLLASIDYFLFPSLYPHETQSIVVPEALAAGAWVIAFDHRFVGELLRGGCGTLVDSDEDYALAAVECIMSATSAAAREARKREASMHGRRIREHALKQRDQFLRWFEAPY